MGKAPLLLSLALASSPAVAAPIEGYAAVGLGYRHALGPDLGGLSYHAMLGGIVGPIGLEYEAVWSSDHSLSKREERVFARSDNWFTFQGRIRASDRFSVLIGGGPGLGTIKRGGKPEEVGGVWPSWGLREQVRFEFPFSDDDFVLAAGLRLTVEQHWQPVILPSPEIAIGQLYFRLGPRRS